MTCVKKKYIEFIVNSHFLIVPEVPKVKNSTTEFELYYDFPSKFFRGADSLDFSVFFYGGNDTIPVSRHNSLALARDKVEGKTHFHGEIFMPSDSTSIGAQIIFYKKNKKRRIPDFPISLIQREED